MSKKLFFISTNNSWSGSEVLWTNSAKDFLSSGYAVAFATQYKHDELSKIDARHYIFSERHKKSTAKKIIEKFLRVKLESRDILSEILKIEMPQLVILSQGNNIDQDEVMKCCYNLKIPYITITNLVTEFHFLGINKINLNTLQQGYLKASKNFFVSQKNLELNNRMLSLHLSNAEVIFCPCVIKEEEITDYPEVDRVYKVGLVGRIECFHKGYDLLLEVAGKQKWRQRSIHFNIYGDGPHLELLRQNIFLLKLNNITLKGYKKSVGVWEENHILFMPSRMEGLALSLIEAMYCNRAAIVTDVGDATVLIEDGVNGFVADFPAVDFLDEALERAWDKRENWKQLGSNAAITLKTKYAENAVEYFNKKVMVELSGKSELPNSE